MCQGSSGSSTVPNESVDKRATLEGGGLLGFYLIIAAFAAWSVARLLHEKWYCTPRENWPLDFLDAGYQVFGSGTWDGDRMKPSPSVEELLGPVLRVAMPRAARGRPPSSTETLDPPTEEAKKCSHASANSIT